MKMRLLWVTVAMAMGAAAAMAVPQDHTSTVAAVRADLVARNVDLQGACGAFAITGRVAYQLRAEGWGLIAKNPGQNGCSINGGRYAVDALQKTDGSAIDLLINAETENTPAWQVTGSTSPDNWRAPFAMDSDTPVPPTPPVPPVPPTPTDPTIALRLKALEEAVVALTARPVYTGCKASLFGFNVSCTLVK